ncbi:hypothetical protein Y032_0560g3473 [Ancylostoma ceylanicum]|uniref:Carbohydrate sulfotransferase n=1 Tax=Ancylostoma ceylanicum TaxID=53326 RepID=A0A016WQX8_9BILA|nr:hypothetical protein Y032_0560g3473 [Ancylostoma ceylanicum]
MPSHLDSKPHSGIGRRLPSNIDSILASIKDGNVDTTPYDRSRILPPFHRFMEKFEVSFKYSISLCIMPKAMCTLGTAIFCFLNNPAKFKANGRRISTETWATSLCRGRLLHDNYTRSEKFLGSTRLAFIRHPVDRFLSGFVNKCILKTANEGADHCYGCGANLSCFMDRFSQHLWEVYRSNNRTQRFFITNHMAPQSWSCNFKEHLRDFILIYFGSEPDAPGKAADQVYKVLENVGVPTYLRNEIRQEMAIGRSHHSTTSTAHRLEAERELFTNQTLLRTLVELYYYDFVLFGHPLPTLRANAMES